MASVSDHLVSMFANDIAEIVRLLETERDAHVNTLNLLKSVKLGATPLSRVVMSDDGWQVMPELPTPEDE